VKLPGKPDIVFTRAKIVIFVDGCFWHGCPIHGTRPKTNQIYWHPKIARNQARDAEVIERLGQLGWTGVRVWEHEVATDLDGVVARVVKLWRTATSF
jgi:DNA mismatch endonuclease (patch repair protein)